MKPELRQIDFDKFYVLVMVGGFAIFGIQCINHPQQKHVDIHCIIRKYDTAALFLHLFKTIPFWPTVHRREVHADRVTKVGLAQRGMTFVDGVFDVRTQVVG